MFLRIILLIISIITFFHSIMGQCTTTVNSSDGYTVTVDITPTAIVAPGSCPYGYNFNVELIYDVQFSGSNIPGSLYTLQGNINCDNFSNIFFDLPNSGGSGTTTTTSNPYNSDNDCATATPSSLGCNDAVITINGPGISSQQVNCEATSLPINLQAFKAEVLDNNQVSLIWITTSELNNDFFTIEKSYDLKEWNIISRISGAGNSNKILDYEIFDSTPISRITYYRIKQTDFDGKFEYFPAIAVAPKQNSEKLRVNYDHIKNSYTISDSYKELNTLQFFDIYGRIIDVSHAASFLSSELLEIKMNSLSTPIVIVKSESGSLKLFSHN